MAYIGIQPAEKFTSFATQEFSTSATTSYTLDHAVANENEIALFVNNVRQQPGSGKAYTATGTALTLSAATASTDTMYCIFLGRALQTVTPATNSISTAMISDNAITAAKATGFGKIAQVVTATDTSARSTTSTTFVTASSGATVNITPSATSSKIFIICTGSVSCGDGNDGWVTTIYRDSTNIGHATSGLATGTSVAGVQASYYPMTMAILDSPSTTSQVTYQLYVKTINADSDGSTTTNIGHTVSGSGNPVPTHITAFEVLA